jgi:hypothetical protein
LSAQNQTVHENGAHGMTRDLTASELTEKLKVCNTEISKIVDSSGNSMCDPKFEGYWYIFADQQSTEKYEWSNTLSQKPLIWVYESTSKTIRQALKHEIQAQFKHFKFSPVQNNSNNNHIIEKSLQTEHFKHPHKLWEKKAAGKAGGPGTAGRIGKYYIGVTYRTTALPGNWCVSNEKPKMSDFTFDE